jgi:hypothetical protein
MPVIFETLGWAASLAFLVLPIVLAIGLVVKRRLAIQAWTVSFLAGSACCYLLLLVSVKLFAMHDEARLHRFDLDGDGMFSGAEVTPAMEEAMAEFAADTGSGLAPITGLFVSPIYCGFWHAAIGVPSLLMGWSNRMKRIPAP